jgi:hypothetical protein
VGKLAALDDATEKARKRAAAAASGEVALKGAQNMLVFFCVDLLTCFVSC